MWWLIVAAIVVAGLRDMAADGAVDNDGDGDRSENVTFMVHGGQTLSGHKHHVLIGGPGAGARGSAGGEGGVFRDQASAGTGPIVIVGTYLTATDILFDRWSDGTSGSASLNPGAGALAFSSSRLKDSIFQHYTAVAVINPGVHQGFY